MRPQQNYQRVNISTADPVRVVVLLYEGAIKNLNQAMRLMGPNNEEASARLTRAIDIVNYLRGVLDHETGGVIAKNLDRLYEYMRDTLTQANYQLDKEKIRAVIGLLQTLLEGWRGIISNQTTEVEAAQEITPPALPTQPLGLSMIG